MTIRVMVIDDQAMIRGALAGLLDLETDIEVVAQAANGVEALDELARLSVEETAPRTRASRACVSSWSRPSGARATSSGRWRREPLASW